MKLILIATMISTASVEVTPTSLFHDGALTSVVFNIRSMSSANIRGVYVECTFYDKNNIAINSAPEIVKNISPYTTAHGKASVRKNKNISTADCRAVKILQPRESG